MSRGTHGDGRIIRLLAGEPWPPHDGTGDLEGATDRLDHVPPRTPKAVRFFLNQTPLALTEWGAGGLA